MDYTNYMIILMEEIQNGVAVNYGVTVDQLLSIGFVLSADGLGYEIKNFLDTDLDGIPDVLYALQQPDTQGPPSGKDIGG